MRNLVIANRGKSQIGKTPAILLVYSLLKNKGYSIVEERWQGGDIRAIFDMDGIKVGIESQGDPGYEMEATMEDFVKTGCEIIVTACRTKSSTLDAVSDFLGMRNGFDIIWYTHYIYEGSNKEQIRSILNRRYAMQVVQLIEDRIAGRL